jgi:hypothetical protein
MGSGGTARVCLWRGDWLVEDFRITRVPAYLGLTPQLLCCRFRRATAHSMPGQAFLQQRSRLRALRLGSLLQRNDVRRRDSSTAIARRPSHGGCLVPGQRRPAADVRFGTLLSGALVFGQRAALASRRITESRRALRITGDIAIPRHDSIDLPHVLPCALKGIVTDVNPAAERAIDIGDG